MMKFLICLFLLFALARSQGKFEVPISGFPQYGVPSGSNIFQDETERAMEVLLNIARISPLTYRNDFIQPFMNGTDTSYLLVYNVSTALPAQPPVYWNLNLNRAARAHGADVYQFCPFNLTHNNCQNTSNAATRVADFATSFSRSSYSGENFVNQNQFAQNGNKMTCNNYRFWPLVSMSGFICDGFYLTSCKFASCVNDTSAGHRQGIMRATNTQVGIGNIWVNASYYGITTHDFSGDVTPFNTTLPLITSASHIWFNPNQANSYKYMAVVNSQGNAITSVVVNINGVSETLSVYASLNSTIAVYQSAVKTFNSSCDTYYFVLNYGNGLNYTYPQQGAFKLTDNTTCTTNWVSNVPSPSPTPAPTTSPSTSPSTTPSSTPVNFAGTYSSSFTSTCPSGCCCFSASVTIVDKSSTIDVTASTTGNCLTNATQTISFSKKTPTTGSGSWNNIVYEYNKNGKQISFTNTNNTNCNFVLTCVSGLCSSSPVVVFSYVLLLVLMSFQVFF